MFIELNTGELLLFDVFIIMKVRMFMQQRGTMRPIQNWRSSLYNTQKTELLVMHLNWSMVQYFDFKFAHGSINCLDSISETKEI